MKKEYSINEAITAAEYEGMTGRCQPIPRARLRFDELALIRAEGEGMTGLVQSIPSRRLRFPEEPLAHGVPAEIPR